MYGFDSINGETGVGDDGGVDDDRRYGFASGEYDR